VEILSTNSHASTVTANLTGNEFAQTIIGNAGENDLRGGGGADVLIGLGGDDTYYVGLASVQVRENAGGGADEIFASSSYTLGANAEIERLVAQDAGTMPLTLTGNHFNQTIFGNEGNNILHGGGGVDILRGFGGNDVYYTDVFLTTIVEAVGGGNDSVYVSVGYALGAGQEVELLSTSSHAATHAINLGGNEFANTLLGNAGANILNGGGGSDLLHGFGGNDIYYVDHADDRVFEGAGGGNDTVYASASYTLTASQHIEGLAATNRAGTGAINLTGNPLANSVGGNAGANVLNGGGGNDYLHGLDGADTFAFTTPVGPGNPSNVDVLADFSVADDTIALENDVFVGLPIGALNPSAFRTGASAQDADDRIIYNSATGQLFFDADGSGAEAQVHFATVTAEINLIASDFIVF
jgi:Ca2+-binding RTX toxin-like protein